jgi:hypothetical protein
MNTQPTIDNSTLKPEQLTQYISASHDSCVLISYLVALDIHNDENNDTVRRNINHLQDCLINPQIIESATNADKTAFSDSVALGESWLA